MLPSLFIPSKMLVPNCNRLLTSAQKLLRNGDVSELRDEFGNVLKIILICHNMVVYVVIKGMTGTRVYNQTCSSNMA